MHDQTFAAFRCALTVMLLAASANVALAEKETGRPTADAASSSSDWPQWRGPNRDGVSRENRLADEMARRRAEDLVDRRSRNGGH